MTRPRDLDLLPYGLALLALGVDMAAVTFLSLSEPNVTFARSRWTALAAMLIGSPPLLLYVLCRRGQGDWWRAFWTAGLLAYLAHFWWAVFVIYEGDFKAIIGRQGFVAYTNFLVTLLWTVDVALAWVPNPFPRAAAIGFRFFTWALVAASFITASAVFRSGTVRELGYALSISLIVAIGVRLFGFRRAENGAAD